MDRINGADTIDIGGGKRGFRSENLVAGVAGTEVTDLFLNATQEEIMKVITEAGLLPDEADWSQLLQALKVLGLSTGSKNRRWTAITSMTVTAPPAGAALGDTYLIPAGATGAWAANIGKIAEWTLTGATGWSYMTPSDGHGIGLPDGRVFVRIGGEYVEWESLTFTTNKLSRLPWLSVTSMTVTAPPASPARGDCYLIPTGATGLWAANVGKIAEWTGSDWAYATPLNGHGISLPDGRVFERIGGTYVEKLALDVQSGKSIYGVAGGTVNALTLSLDPAPTAYSSGMAFRVLLTATNSAAATLNVNGLGPIAIKRSGGGDLLPGDLPSGTIVDFVYDGTQIVLRTLPSTISANASIFSTPGTTAFVVPAGVYRIRAKVWGGGGGGGGNTTAASLGSGGGGAGGYCEGSYQVVPGQSINVTVGAAGIAGTNAPTAGGIGGTSSFGSFCAATGGSGGGGPGGGGGNGGTSTGGQLNANGYSGGSQQTYSSGSTYGGGFGGPGYGFSNNGPNIQSGGQSGGFPGSGGNGSAANAYGGAGAPGRVILEW